MKRLDVIVQYFKHSVCFVLTAVIIAVIDVQLQVSHLATGIAHDDIGRVGIKHGIDQIRQPFLRVRSDQWIYLVFKQRT